VILRGGSNLVNYTPEAVAEVCQRLEKAKQKPNVMIDCSHAKQPEGPQPPARCVPATLPRRSPAEDSRIIGVMIESSLVAGAQKMVEGKPLTYGQSITDACIGWDEHRDPAEGTGGRGKTKGVKRAGADVQFIDLKAQYAKLQTEIDRRMRAVLTHGQFILGPEVEELETRLAARTGSQHCVACSSGTDALLIALMALGVGAGDEVITTPFTFVATVETIALLGATPVFVDIDPRTYNLDPTLLAAVITPRTKAVMAVSLYGQCAEMDAINAIAAERRASR